MLGVVFAVTRASHLSQARYVVRPELSVQDVSIGSVVRLNGVVVGHVARISFWSDPVTGRLRPELVLALDASLDASVRDLGARVADGLRVQFISVNPASGLLETDLVWSPGSPCLRATADADELPWQASPQQQALARAVEAMRPLTSDLRPRVEALLANLHSVEMRVSEGPVALAAIAARAERLRSALQQMESAVSSGDLATAYGRLGEIREGLRVAMVAMEAINQDLADLPRPTAEALRAFSESCRASAERLRREVPGDATR